jgi:superfamily II DNA or RNA helicase
VQIKIEKVDEVFIRVFTEASIEQELSAFFTFEVPCARFTPAFRARMWDGKIRMFDLHRKTLYLGLVDYLVKFAKRNDYEIEYLNKVIPDENVDIELVNKFANYLDLYGKGKPIDIRDYQIEAIHHGLNNNRAILLSPTGSGKSLIIYTLSRWHLENDRKVIVVVPTTSLVEQMYSDFIDYSSNNKWNVEKHCQKLYSGFPKEFTSSVLFTTWQSIYKQPKSWFDQFDVVIGDEAHQFKAKSLTSIMEKLTETKYRIGTTGSLDDSKVNKLVLEGCFGPVHRVTTTKKLMDENKLANIKIKCIVLKYEESIRKLNKGMEYQKEMDYIVSNEKRNKFIRNLALSCTGNTILLFQYVEKHGKILHQYIKEKAGENRKIFFVHGGTDVTDRESIRHITEQETDAIIVASYGTFSTGINIPSLENVIFASPTKSKIRNLQSIGRGLRLKDGKSYCKLFDIADDLSYKAYKNHTLKHAAERYKLYVEEEFPMQLVEVDL